jgi:hypothetical protein
VTGELDWENIFGSHGGRWKTSPGHMVTGEPVVTGELDSGPGLDNVFGRSHRWL